MTAHLRAAMLVLAAPASLACVAVRRFQQRWQRETLAFLKKNCPRRTFTPAKTVDVIATKSR